MLFRSKSNRKNMLGLFLYVLSGKGRMILSLLENS